MTTSKLWPTPQASTNRKSRKAMTPSTNNGRRSGSGNSSPPGLEQMVELSLGIMPREMDGLQMVGARSTEAQLTLFAGDSPAKTSAWRGSKQVLVASEADYGKSSPELLARFDPDGRCWRTSQTCLLETTGDGFSEFSETWPRSGLMRSGTVYRLPPLVRIISATGFGSWPTPQASDSTSGGRKPDDLATVAAIWPTPTSRDHKDTGDCANVPVNALLGRSVKPSKAGGSLNPTWVEGLMGFPHGWTDVSDED